MAARRESALLHGMSFWDTRSVRVCSLAHRHARGYSALSPHRWETGHSGDSPTPNAKLNMATKSRSHRTPLLHTAAGVTGILMLCACASTPQPPTANLQEARHAIAVADQAEAGRYAPQELSAARANLAAANAAVGAERMVTAQRLADESTADAELASARTADVMADSVNSDMKRSTATLIEEMQRSSGDPQ
jgi:hypothetical protein